MGVPQLLAVYIMHQYLKKEASFFFPYLRILPMPTPLPEWTQEELEQLQDAYVGSAMLRATGLSVAC